MKTLFLSCCFLFTGFFVSLAASRTIYGTVKDDAGNPLITQILVKETGARTSSGQNGQFSIVLNLSKATLLFSAVGYEQQEIIVRQKNQLAVTMKQSDNTLDEVIIFKEQMAKARDFTKKAQNQIASASALFSRQPYQMNTYKTSPGVNRPGLISHTVIPPGYNHFDREGYDYILENPYRNVLQNPLSTFSIDVDAASYSNIRRLLRSGQLPPKGAVRIEEMINYFHYSYEDPQNNQPFAVHTELAPCPWNKDHQLVLIGLQGKHIDLSDLPPSNLTFLIDVSGSMNSPDKLPLVQSSLKLLVDQLRPVDRVAIVVYAGNAGLVLPSTSGDRGIAIKEAIDRLEAGGSTAGGAGIELAYKVAMENFKPGGNNRVILCTDGDFNVGASSDDALERMIEEKRQSGVFLTVLGFGTGNYQDAKMQKLADKGNGNHAYIDQPEEAKKVFVNEFGGTLFTIAKDVKLQVEFNPKQVQAYRLIGYENRLMAREDFNNDQKDAGDLGSGHTVTALYELVPPGVKIPQPVKSDSLRYQVMIPAVTTEQQKFSGEIMHVKLRYKEPASNTSKLLSVPVKAKTIAIDKASVNFRFAASVASFGMLLRDSEYKGTMNYQSLKTLAQQSLGSDAEGYRREFIRLIDMASKISQKRETTLIYEDK